MQLFSVRYIFAIAWSGVAGTAADILERNLAKDAIWTRSGFKTSDQVQGQGVRPIGKAQHTWVCEHLPEACNAAIEPKMGF